MNYDVKSLYDKRIKSQKIDLVMEMIKYLINTLINNIVYICNLYYMNYYIKI